MGKNFLTGRRPLLLLTLCLTLLFWLCLLVQIATTTLLASSQKAIPAFVRLSVSSISNDISDCPADKDALLAYLQNYDKQIQLISCHTEKNYTDCYFFSPKIKQNGQDAILGSFNLQAAITQKYVYFGIPLISYDF
jgi:hypothetical protein